MANKKINDAKMNKKDEFYTQLADIENELRHYKTFFKDKTVFCNCDDPYESNFFKYFALNFNHLGLKKLITTCYKGSSIVAEQLSLFDVNGVIVSKGHGKEPYKIEITEVSDFNGDGAYDMSDVEFLLKNRANTLTLLKGDGDFRSAECVNLLKEADIVVTNPPFSLFREFTSQLIEYNKKFIILGNQSIMTTKDIFPLIKNDLMWVGYNYNQTMEFRVPDHYDSDVFDLRGNKIVKVPAISWFTNIDISKHHQDRILYKKYSPEEYKSYYNYDGINILDLSDIPKDYDGHMGVPLTFLNDYNPEQFEIIGLASQVEKTMMHTVSKDGKEIHFIKDGNVVWRTPYTVSERKAGNSLRLNENGLPGRIPFGRVIVRNKKVEKDEN